MLLISETSFRWTGPRSNARRFGSLPRNGIHSWTRTTTDECSQRAAVKKANGERSHWRNLSKNAQIYSPAPDVAMRSISKWLRSYSLQESTHFLSVHTQRYKYKKTLTSSGKRNVCSCCNWDSNSKMQRLSLRKSIARIRNCVNDATASNAVYLQINTLS